MTDEPGKWRGIQGGSIDEPYIGAHVIEPSTGLRGQVIGVLDDDRVEIRLEDGRIVVGRPS